MYQPCMKAVSIVLYHFQYIFRGWFQFSFVTIAFSGLFVDFFREPFAIHSQERSRNTSIDLPCLHIQLRCQTAFCSYLYLGRIKIDLGSPIVRLHYVQGECCLRESFFSPVYASAINSALEVSFLICGSRLLFAQCRTWLLNFLRHCRRSPCIIFKAFGLLLPPFVGRRNESSESKGSVERWIIKM